MITKILLVLKKYSWVIALSYSVFLGIISLIDVSEVPKIEVEESDKILHVMAYGMLTLLWYLALKFASKKFILVKIAIGCFIYGIIIEFLQGKLATQRSSEFNDIIANFIGILLAIVLVLIVNRTKVKNVYSFAF